MTATTTRPRVSPPGAGACDVHAGRRPSVAEIDARTPADRNRVIDLLRVTALGCVVVGHWLMAVVFRTPDGGVGVARALEVVPATRALTWVLQVMPIFFLVGGYANTRAWDAAETKGTPYASWLRARARRLLAPAVALFAVWIPLTALLSALGLSQDLLRTGTQSVVVPLWFLAVYLVVVAAAPLALRAHRRFSLAVPVALVGLAVVCDVAHQAGVPVVGQLNFLWVWGALHQVGIAWSEGALDRVRRPTWAALGALALASTVALVTWGPYMVSMVGVDGGAGRSNNSPPSLALLTLGLAQTCLVHACLRVLQRFAARPRVWALTVAAGSVAMPVYLWHMSALVAVFGLTAAGLVPDALLASADGTIGGGWWVARPAWFALLGGVCAVIVTLARRVGSPSQRGGARSGRGTVAGVLLAAGAISLLANRGFTVAGAPLGIDWLPFGLLAGGLALLGLLPLPGRTAGQ